jgi:hypothetical protein
VIDLEVINERMETSMPGPTMLRVRSVAFGYVLVNLLLGLVVAYGCFLLANDVIGVARAGDTLVGTLPIKAQIRPGLVPVPAGLHLDGSVAATLQAEQPTSAQAALSAAIDACEIAFYVAVLWLLRGIAGSIRRREPFGTGTVRRLRAIGIFLLVGTPILEAIHTGLAALQFRRLPATQTVGLNPAGYTFPDGALIAGLGALILAQVFALGHQLREDAEGTI